MNEVSVATQHPASRKRWIWYSVLLMTIVVLFAVASPFVKNYYVIQHLKEIGGTVDTKPGRLLNLLPSDWEPWLRDNLGDAWLLPFEDVTAVTLRGAKVTDHEMVYLQGFTKLEYLSLRNTNVTDVGLIEINRFTQLKGIGFQGEDITNVGLKHLQKVSNLETLWLNNTGETNAGLLHLKELKKLKLLRIHNSLVTYAAIKDLEVALPDCDIFWTPKHKKRKPFK